MIRKPFDDIEKAEIDAPVWDGEPRQPGAHDPLQLLANMLAKIASACAPTDGVVPEALDASQAATLCGISKSKWHAMNAAGQCPAPVELGDRCPRWLRSELMGWLRHGAPTRVRWVMMREQVLRRAS